MKKSTTKSIKQSALYDYSGVHEREETIEFLTEFAKKSKEQIEKTWEKTKRYYDGNHDIAHVTNSFTGDVNIPWQAAESTDGYILVESQIDPSIPSFEFSPRDKSDTDKAKQRESIVKYICDNNNLAFKNTRNERRLGILGTSIWKVCWDSEARFGEGKGDVAVLCPDPYEIYPDPTAKDVDSCEYIGYVYSMHKQKAARIFREDFKERGETLSDFISEKGLFSHFSRVNVDSYDEENDNVTITEWWFRQPWDGKCDITHKGSVHHYEWNAGDIALCILINGKEVRYIPKYWKKTCFNNFPFVISSRIPSEKWVWGKSELQMIIPLIDAKDRELAFAQLNGAFSSNDIILMEENALCDTENLDNSPGAVWKLRPGMTGKVQRLGNMSSSQSGLYSGAMFWQNLIESTTGNFEISQGKEPTSVTTATGIALLNERSQMRRNRKNVDRNEGFKRLFELIDKTALEYYSDGKVIRIGASGDDEMVYRYGGFIKRTREGFYIPSVDITIHTGEGIENSRAFTLSALTSLIGMNITKDNYKFVKAYVENIGIPERKEIFDFLDERFGNAETIEYDDIMKILEETQKGE